MSARKANGKEPPKNRDSFVTNPVIPYSDTTTKPHMAVDETKLVYLNMFQVVKLAASAAQHLSRRGTYPDGISPDLPAEAAAILLATSGQLNGTVWQDGMPFPVSGCRVDAIW